jgi:hypothetical protein
MATIPNYYLPPGTYISQGYLSNTIILANLPLAVCLVGPGSPVLTNFDIPVRRGFITREELTFASSGSIPHLATLATSSDQVTVTTTLEKFDGLNYVPIDSKYWTYVDATHLELSSEAYSAVPTYYLSYQSISTHSDVLPGVGPTLSTPDVRSVIRVGDRPLVSQYTQDTDYTVGVAFTNPVLTPPSTSTGTVTFGAGNTYSALEPRIYTIYIQTPGASGVATFNWYGNTPAAGSGVGVTTGSNIPLQDGIVVSFTGTFLAGDTYTFTVGNTGAITWGVAQTLSETKLISDIYTDYTGVITGTPNNTYIMASHIPTGGITLTGSGSGSIPATHISGTNYITVPATAKSAAPLTLSYSWDGDAPSFGQVYYISYSYAKPATAYDSPNLVFSEQELYSNVGLADAQNLLALAGQIAFQQGMPFMFYVQIQDPDGDGQYTDIDYIDGIKASEAKYEITDVVVLSTSTQIREALRTSVRQCSSSYAKKYRRGWFYMPFNTSAGDTSTPGTLVYESRIVMQEPPGSPALGRYILMGQTWISKDFRMGDGTVQSLTLPGWAIATALAALQASFPSPSDTLLHKSITGFTDIESFGVTEMNYRAGNNLFMIQNNGGNFQVYDTCTVHGNSEDVHEPSAGVQKDAVTRSVAAQMDQNVIALVPQSTADAVAYIRAQLALVLTSLVANGTIAAYEDASGNIRMLNPYNDIWVDRVSGSRTGYMFKYFFFLRYPIKRLFGEYFVDQNIQFGAGGTPTVANV